MVGVLLLLVVSIFTALFSAAGKPKQLRVINPSQKAGECRVFKTPPDSCLVFTPERAFTMLRSDTLAVKYRFYYPTIFTPDSPHESLYSMVNKIGNQVSIHLCHYRYTGYPDEYPCNIVTLLDTCTFSFTSPVIPEIVLAENRPALKYTVGDTIFRYRKGGFKLLSKKAEAEKKMVIIEKKLTLLRIGRHRTTKKPLAVFINDTGLPFSYILTPSDDYFGVPLWDAPLLSELAKYRIRFTLADKKGNGTLLSAEYVAGESDTRDRLLKKHIR